MRLKIIIFFLIGMIGNSQSKPYASIKIKKGFYIEETEMDVSSWISYYEWVKHFKGEKAARNVLPDSSAVSLEVWKFLKQRKYKDIYRMGKYTFLPINGDRKERGFNSGIGFSHPYASLLLKPISGLSYEQVVAFCKWRSRFMGEGKYIYRLPTPQERKEIALKELNGNSLADSITPKGCERFNYCSEKNCVSMIANYCPTSSNIFDFFGNVSEMTSQKGVAVGGNYLLPASHSHVDSIQYYCRAKKQIGFRCVIVEKGSKWDLSNWDQDAIPPKQENSFTDLRDKKTYRTVRIGKQVWLGENLAYRPAEGKYWAYENNESYVFEYGYLYTWETANKVCPDGWHLPLKEEFDVLLRNKTNNLDNILFTDNGLLILMCGFRVGVNFIPIREWISFWSSTPKNNKYKWRLSIDKQNSVYKLSDSYSKNTGLPVRCVKDN